MGNGDSRLEEEAIALSCDSTTPEPLSTNTKSQANTNRPHHPALRSIDLSFINQCSEPNHSPITPDTHTSPDSPHSPPIQLKSQKSLNGITDQYISSRICEIAAMFWQTNIETLPLSEQLVKTSITYKRICIMHRHSLFFHGQKEVGCAIF
eukprot:893047_1